MSYTPTIIDHFKVTKNSLVIYPYNYDRRTPDRKPDQDTEKQKVERFTGHMSRHTRKKVQMIVENWCMSIDEVMKQRKQSKKQHYKYMTFVTLTLSAEQLHTDQQVKRLMLNRFLIYLQRYYKVNEYLWVAEKQKNGNIHFHILCNKPIHWRKIRDEWNRIQATHGYIDRFERKHNHRDPNSTDIHGLENVEKIESYICKYLTKKQEGPTVEGRLWSCTRSLNSMVAYGGVLDNEVIKIMEWATNKGIVTKHVHDYVTEYRGPCLSILRKVSAYHETEARIHFTTLYSLIATRQEKRLAGESRELPAKSSLKATSRLASRPHSAVSATQLALPFLGQRFAICRA